MTARARRVFVIDDDPSVCRAVGRLLGAAGYRVETFDCGAAFLRRRPPRGAHCLVVDVRMPGMSGPELRDALRARGSSSPIIFMTAHDIEELDELRMETVFSKPVEGDLLLRAIDEAMDGTATAGTPRRAQIGRR